MGGDRERRSCAGEDDKQYYGGRLDGNRKDLLLEDGLLLVPLFLQHLGTLERRCLPELLVHSSLCVQAGFVRPGGLCLVSLSRVGHGE